MDAYTRAFASTGQGRQFGSFEVGVARGDRHQFRDRKAQLGARAQANVFGGGLANRKGQWQRLDSHFQQSRRDLFGYAQRPIGEWALGLPAVARASFDHHARRIDHQPKPAELPGRIGPLG